MLSASASSQMAKIKEGCVEVAKAADCLKSIGTSFQDLENDGNDALILQHSLGEIASLVESKNSADHPEFTKSLRESGLVTACIDFMIAALGNADRESGSRAKIFHGIVGNISQTMFSIFLNCTNWSLDFCRQLSQQEKYFKDFYPRLLSSQDAKPLETRTMKGNAVYFTIGAVFNSYFKNDSEVFSRLSEFDLVSCTKPYLQCADTTVSTAALVLIAFAVDEKQSDVFLGARANIAFLIENLRRALESPNRNWRGYDVLEVAKCIRRLALNDANKDLLIELNLLPTLTKLLSSSNDDDVAEGIEILFTLSFSKKFRQKIWTEFHESITGLQSSEKWRSSKQLQGLAFQLQESTERPGSAGRSASTAAAGSKPSRRVMISYNHGSRAIVERLHQMLTAAKVDVWVDFKNMKTGSVYQAMADGIEGSSVVLMCISRLYNESSNCRLEVEYAHECGKKLIPLLLEPRYRPSGWLGLLTRAELRYDLTETKQPFEAKVQELLDALGSYFNQLENVSSSRPGSAVTGQRRGHELPTQSPVLPPIGSSQQLQTQPQQPRRSRVASSIRAWDAERVAAWCRDQRLPAEIEKRGLTGVELQFLAGTLARSPEYFGRVLEKHFELGSLLDLATFVAAVENLLDCE